MTTLYADRAFLSINGARIADLQSATLTQNLNAKEVPTMTPDRRNRGFTQGNRTISIDASIAVRNQQARPKLENMDYENNDIQVSFLVGADVYTAIGVWITNTEDAAGGVGDEVKTKFTFGALDLVDSVGNSSLFSLAL